MTRLGGEKLADTIPPASSSQTDPSGARGGQLRGASVAYLVGPFCGEFVVALQEQGGPRSLGKLAKNEKVKKMYFSMIYLLFYVIAQRAVRRACSAGSASQWTNQN